MEKALHHATSGRPGPVWLDIPLDLQSTNVENKPLQSIPFFESKTQKVSNSDISLVIDKLKKATRPTVLIGSGIRSAQAENLLIELIENKNIPLVYSNSAPDIYGNKNNLSIGSIGSMGSSRAGNFCLQNSDLVLVL